MIPSLVQTIKELNLDFWVLFGFFAQFLFFMRFFIQWLASERKGESVIPLSFWLFSVAGGFCLLLYAIHKVDPVFILGQGLGLIIYLRNLALIFRKKKTISE
ncbi:MAG: lipid-A-disaccharide synthase N-terminal domain-containing protein [Proteobacteria bacterium]|nr:lipid-A-disaccharide synthase N-terminal domain-containing protein [Pseudomonadota bacterium]